jgi:hypothetical protein
VIKISLAVGENRLAEVTNSSFFEKIDTLAKSAKIIDLADTFDLE